jgi:hypothetical protein
MQVRKKKMGAEGRVSEARAVYSELPGHMLYAYVSGIPMLAYKHIPLTYAYSM